MTLRARRWPALLASVALAAGVASACAALLAACPGGRNPVKIDGGGAVQDGGAIFTDSSAYDGSGSWLHDSASAKDSGGGGGGKADTSGGGRRDARPPDTTCARRCAGKVCGAADGCGGKCAAGSGCCTPSCANKICGAADGCGGTCAAGSGCCVAGKEALDGKDNDCDGKVDEGFWASDRSVTYATLAAHHPQCTASNAHSINCYSAAHRYCASLGFTGGFGPVEFGAADGIIVCLGHAQSFGVPVATLTAEHGGCTASNIFSLFCNSAIHRHCAKKAGFVSGVGPVEFNGSQVYFICVRHARTRTVSFTTLAAHHGQCSAGNSFSPPCKAAINRYCRAQGHQTGFGPVEQGADAHVTCLNRQ